MSVEEFREIAVDALEQQRLDCEKCLQELSYNLPNREYDDLDAWVYFPLTAGYCQAIEDSLESAGYDVTYVSAKRSYLIEFSDAVKREMEEERRRNDERYEERRKVSGNK